MTDYLFNGEKIKLNARDYYRMVDLYPNLDLTKELEQLDFELREEKKWFMVMNAKLNYRNKKAVKAGSTKTRSIETDLTDTSWAQGPSPYEPNKLN